MELTRTTTQGGGRQCPVEFATSIQDTLQKVAEISADTRMTPRQQEDALVAFVSATHVQVQGVLTAYLAVLVAVAAEMLVLLLNDQRNLGSSQAANWNTVSQKLGTYCSLSMNYGSSFQKRVTKLAKADKDFRVRMYAEMRNIRPFTLIALEERMEQLKIETSPQSSKSAGFDEISGAICAGNSMESDYYGRKRRRLLRKKTTGSSGESNPREVPLESERERTGNSRRPPFLNNMGYD